MVLRSQPISAPLVVVALSMSMDLLKEITGRLGFLACEQGRTGITRQKRKSPLVIVSDSFYQIDLSRADLPIQ